MLVNKPKKPRPYDCCNIPSNMKVQHPRKDMTIETCKICQRKHYRLKLENAQSKLTMT